MIKSPETIKMEAKKQGSSEYSKNVQDCVLAVLQVSSLVSLVFSYFDSSEASFTEDSLVLFNKVAKYGGGVGNATLRLFDEVVNGMGYRIPKNVYSELSGEAFNRAVSSMEHGWFFNKLFYRVSFASSDDELENLARAITYESWVKKQQTESLGCPFCGFGSISGLPEIISFSTELLNVSRIWIICSYLLARNDHSGTTVAKVFIQSLVKQLGFEIPPTVVPQQRYCALSAKLWRFNNIWKWKFENSEYGKYYSKFDFEANDHLCPHHPKCRS